MSGSGLLSAPFGAEPGAILDVAAKVAREGFVVPSEVTLAAREVAAHVAELSPARVRAGFESVIMAPHLGEGLQWLHDAGALAVLLPELDATVDFSQEGGRRHKDVWEHTKLVVKQSPVKPIVRWSALLHDIGKVPTRVMLPDGRVTFHRHAEVGARMFDAVARRLQFDREGKQRIRFLIYHHLRANAYHCSWTDSAVRRFDLEMGRHLDELVELSLADVTSRRPGRRQEASENVEALVRRIHEVRALDAKVPPLPAGLGNAFMEAFGIAPGRRIGELCAICEDAIEKGELEERKDPPYYIEFLRGRGITG
ncbi:MAG TPA: HD domain-containing protein [Polyangia bacterium]